jgi:hypothetical protein
MLRAIFFRHAKCRASKPQQKEERGRRRQAKAFTDFLLIKKTSTPNANEP